MVRCRTDTGADATSASGTNGTGTGAASEVVRLLLFPVRDEAESKDNNSSAFKVFSIASVREIVNQVAFVKESEEKNSIKKV